MREISRNIVGATLVSKDGKIFLVRSNPAYKGSYEGYWVIPGGGIEEGETPEQAVVRETREETGLDISNYRLEKVHDSRTGQTEKTLKTGERVLVRMKFCEFRVILADRQVSDIPITLSDEHSEFAWHSPSQLSSVQLSPPTRELLMLLGYIS